MDAAFPKRRASLSKISQKALEERLDFSKKPVNSFHEALTRLLPHTARGRQKASPRLTRSAPSSEVKALGHRECLCDQKPKHRKEKDGLPSARCICSDRSDRQNEASVEEKGPEKSFCPANFRSSAVYCEVKLAELLNARDKKLEAEENRPDVYRTASCWQIFSEICKLSMPFARVLLHIKNELEHAIYSSYVAPPGITPSFERLPYFELVQRLEGKNKEMEDRHRQWREELHARQEDITRIEQHMQELRDQVKVAESVGTDLQSKLKLTVEALDVAKSQVKNIQAKSRHLKKDLKRARVVLLQAREADYEREMERRKHQKMQTQYSQLVHELQHTQSFLEAARVEAADSVPKPTYLAAKEELHQLEEKLKVTQTEIDDITNKVTQMTPRPEWNKATGKTTTWRATTAEQVSAICRENNLLSEQLSCLELEWTAAQVALSELMAKLPPEQADEKSKKKGGKDKKGKDKKKKK